MTATIEPPLHRRRTTFGWAEFLPRYLLVEAACRGRKVLEVGTEDPRSLLRLRDGGAAQVVGTTPDPDAVDPSRLLKRSAQIVEMQDGRLDFDDDAFDVVLVVDLARQMAQRPSFLEEVRRVLGDGGFALLGFESGGRGLARLVDDRAPPPLMDAKRLESGVRAVFPEARFYLQTPFIGVAIHPEGNDGTDVALDPSLAASAARPSHLIALVGPGAPPTLDPTLVELPFLDFEATAQAALARSAADVERLLQALADARSQVAKREESLRAIHERLPRLKRAFEARLASLASKGGVVSPTIIERAGDDGLEIPEPVGEAPSDEAVALHEENARLQRAMEAQERDAQLRIRELERVVEDRERQLAALGEDRDSHVARERAFDADYRDAETRAAQLHRQLDDAKLAHAAEVERLEGRISRLMAQLAEPQRPAGEITADLEQERADKEDAERHAEVLEADLARERETVHRLRLESEQLQSLVHERDGQIEQLERGLGDQAAAAGAQREEATAGKALELAASHMAKEVETLRAKVQSLHRERDALAATSQMLLEERDASASTLPPGTPEPLDSAAIEDPAAQATVARLETELAAANARADAHKLALVAETERRKRAEAGEEAEGVPSDRAELIQRTRALEEILEVMKAERSEHQQRYDQLQTILQEMTLTASVTAAELASVHQRCRDLETTAGDSLDQVGHALSAKAAAEARLIEAQQRDQTAQARAAILQAEVAEAAHRLAEREGELSQARATVRALQAEVAQTSGAEHAQRAAQVGELEEALSLVKKDKGDLELALGRTLEEAAALTGTLAELEAAYRETEVALERSESNRARLSSAVDALRSEVAEALADKEAALTAVEEQRAEMQRIERTLQQVQADDALIAQAVPGDLSQQLDTLKAERLAAQERAQEAELRANVLAGRLRELEAGLEAVPDVVVAPVAVSAAGEVVALRHRAGELADEVAFLRSVLQDRDGALRRARAEAVDLRGALAAAGEARQEAGQRVDAQSDAVARLERRAAEAEAEVARLQGELTAHREALAEQEQVQASMADQIEELQAKLHDAEAPDSPAAAELGAQLQAAQKELAAVQQDRAQATFELARREEALAIADARVDRLEQALAGQDTGRWADDATVARVGRQAADRRAAESRAEVLAARAERDDLAEVIAGLRIRLEQTKAELQHARASSTSASDDAPVERPAAGELGRMAELEEQLEVARAAADGADGQLSDTLAKLERARVDLADAEAHIARLEDEAAQMRHSTAQLTSRLSQLERVQTDGQSAQETAQRTVAAAQERVANLEAALSDQTSKSELATKSLYDLSAKHDVVRQALEEARANVDALRSERDALETERDALVAEVSVRTAASEARATALSEAKNKLLTVQRAQVELLRRAEAAEKRRDELAGQLEKASDRLGGLQKAAFEQESDLQAAGDLRSRLAAAEMEVTSLQSQIAGHAGEVEAVHQQLLEARTERDELLGVVEQARKTASVSPAEVARLQARVAELDLRTMADEDRLVAAEAEKEMFQSRVKRLEYELAAARSADAITERDERIKHLEDELQEKSSRIKVLTGLDDDGNPGGIV